MPASFVPFNQQHRLITSPTHSTADGGPSAAGCPHLRARVVRLAQAALPPMTGLPELVAAWVADPRRPTAPMLAALHKAAAGGKENGGKAARDAALQCFKACQAALAAPGATGDAVAAAAAVGRAALAALAATSPSSATAQLAGWRYNFARRLVACKDFGDAHAEAALLFAALRDQPAGGGEAASLAVGTALTLVLCCVEGKLLGDAAAVGGLLDAARALPRWLRCGRWLLPVGACALLTLVNMLLLGLWNSPEDAPVGFECYTPHLNMLQQPSHYPPTST